MVFADFRSPLVAYRYSRDIQLVRETNGQSGATTTRGAVTIIEVRAWRTLALGSKYETYLCNRGAMVAGKRGVASYARHLSR